MAWNGIGKFSRTDGEFPGVDVWETNRKNGIKIVASRHDTHDEDLATGINNLLTRDGQNSPTSDIDMNGFKHTGVGNATARANFAPAGQVQDGGLIFAGTTAGTGAAYTATMTPTISAYVSGAMFFVVVHADNTSTTPTLNIDSIGAKTIVKAGGALALADMKTNVIAWLIYNGVEDELQLINPAT